MGAQSSNQRSKPHEHRDLEKPVATKIRSPPIAVPGKVSVLGIPKGDRDCPSSTADESLKPIRDNIDLILKANTDAHSVETRDAILERLSETRTVTTPQSLLDALSDHMSFGATGAGDKASPVNASEGSSIKVGSADGEGISEWYLLFSTKYNGSSFSQLAAAACQRGPTMLVIEAMPLEGSGSESYSVSVDGSNCQPYWQKASGVAADANTDIGDKRSTPARVFIGGFSTGNWLNNAQRERNAKRGAAANARASRDGGDEYSASPGVASPASGAQPYATGALAFLNPGQSGEVSVDSGAFQPYAPATYSAYASTIPSGSFQSPYYHGNENCWLFRADVFTPQEIGSSSTGELLGPTAGQTKSLSDNYGYFNGRGDFRANTTNLRVFRPNVGSSSSVAKPAANYQYLVDQHHDAEMVGIGMGGDLGSWAWFIDSWLEHGTCNTVSGDGTSAGAASYQKKIAKPRRGANGVDDDDDDGDPNRLRRCKTFNSLLLAPWRNWRVASVELFAVDPLAVTQLKGIDIVRAEAIRRADLKDNGVPSPLNIVPIAVTPEGDFISTSISGANGDLTLAMERNIDQIAKNKKAKRGVLHAEGAATDKLILEMNNKNEFRDDVVEDEKFDRVKGC